MSRIAYVNGRYIRHSEAGVSIDDRAFLFSDGIYEVIEVFDGALIDEAGHLARLGRSARELRLALPVAEAALKLILRELVARNRVTDGHVYLQVTRGAARRDHAFPPPGTPTTLVAFAHRGDRAAAEAKAQAGIKVISLPDIRWKRPDIKTTSLLPNVLARQQAREAGAYEAWLIDEQGFVTEGSASNAWIVDGRGRFGHSSRQFGDSGWNYPGAAVQDRRRAGRPTGRAAFHARRGARCAGSLHQRRDDAGHAGRGHRRAENRLRRAGAGRARPARGVSRFRGRAEA